MRVCVTVLAALLLAGGAAMAGDAPRARPPTSPAPTPAQARRLVDALLVASPYRLPPTARRGHIRYRLGFPGSPRPTLPETGEQHVVAHADHIEVDICADCGREAPPTAAQIARYTAPSPWIESDDRAVTTFAGRHDRGRGLDRRMTSLRDGVRAHVNGPIDFSRYESAAQVLASRSGDCTEVALLLAAVARARGIPARVAYGIAYSSRFTGKAHVFSPHMWVQVWDGARWRSYDAGLERFDAGHIALVVGDGAFEHFVPATANIARLRIEAAAGIAAPDADRSVGR